MISNNELGNLCRINANYYGGWFHNGTHIIDTLIYLFDDKPIFKKIHSFLNTQYINDPSLEISGFMEKSNSNIHLSFIDEKIYQIFDFDLIFSNGRIKIENFEKEIYLYKKNKNSLGENILVKEESDLFQSKELKIHKAIEEICNYLETDDFTILKTKHIENYRATLSSLLQGLFLYNEKNVQNYET